MVRGGGQFEVICQEKAVLGGLELCTGTSQSPTRLLMRTGRIIQYYTGTASLSGALLYNYHDLLLVLISVMSFY